MNHSFCVGPERRNPDVDRVPTASTITQFPRGHPVFYAAGSVFSLLHAGFSSRLSVENRLDALYIYRDELPISITHFWL